MSKAPTFKPVLAPTTVKEESRETKEPSEEELFGTNQRKYLGHYKDFIGIYNKILPPDFCGEVMDAFEQYQRNNSIWQLIGNKFSRTLAFILLIFKFLKKDQILNSSREVEK